MAITWGPAQTSSGTTVQIGLEIGRRQQGNSELIMANAYLRCTAGWVQDSTNTVVWYGRITGTRQNVPINLRAGQQMSLGQMSRTEAKSYSDQSQAVGVRVDGFQIGTPSVSVTYRISKLSYQTPKAPTLSVRRVNDGAIQVSWKFTQTASAPIRRFIVDRQEDGGSNKWVRIYGAYMPKERSYTDRGVSRGHFYNYRILAEGTDGKKSPYDRVNEVYTTPNPPTGLTAVREGSDVLLAWTPHAVGGAKTYIYEGDTTAGSAMIAGPLDRTVYTYHVKNPDPKVPHRYTVAHVTPDYLAASTVSNQVTILATPYAPGGLDPNGGYLPGDTRPHVSWTHRPADGTAQSKAEVQYREQGGESWSTITVNGSAQKAGLPSVSGSGSFEWRVRTWGQDASKPSPWSSTAAFTLASRPTAWFLEPGSNSEIKTGSVTVKMSASRYPVSYRLTVTYGGQSKTYTGYATGKFSRQLTELRNRANVKLSLVVTNKVDSKPVTRFFRVVYAAPGIPTGEMVWDETTGQLLVTVRATKGEVATEKLNLYRQDADERLISMGDGYQDGDTIPDPTPPLVGATYVVEAVAASGTTARSEPIVAPPIPTPATYLNWGTRASRALRFRYDPEQAVSAGRDMVEQQFAGHALPRVVFTDQVSREISLGGTLADEDGVSADTQAHTLLHDLALTDTPVVARLVSGETYTGYVHGIKATRKLWGAWDASCTFVEADTGA